MNNEKKNVFITDDIRLEHINWSDDIDLGYRFDLTENIDDFLRFVDDYSKKATKEQKTTALALLSQFEASQDSETIEAIKDFMSENEDITDEWRDTCSYDEQYSTPMMCAVRFYPDFVDFTEEDRYKVSSNTCLVFDFDNNENSQRWGVAMTGGGMDLAPHLLDTFISLGKGVPSELADSIRLNYNAYVDGQRHKENCKLLAEAYLKKSLRDIDRVKELVPETGDNKLIEEVKRHTKGLETAVKKYIDIPF